MKFYPEDIKLGVDNLASTYVPWKSWLDIWDGYLLSVCGQTFNDYVYIGGNLFPLK